MLRIASALAIALAACGGQISDERSSGEDPARRPTPSEPPQPPAAGPSATPSTPPAGPLPSGPTTTCGLLEGDAESNLAAYGKAQAIGTYDVVAVVDECSGAGGLHVTLQRRRGCASAAVVHFGKHACYDDATWVVGDRAVVGVAPEAGSVTDPGWCLEGVAPWDGVARAIRKLAPSESETQALSAYGCQ